MYQSTNHRHEARRSAYAAFSPNAASHMSATHDRSVSYDSFLGEQKSNSRKI